RHVHCFAPHPAHHDTFRQVNLVRLRLPARQPFVSTPHLFSRPLVRHCHKHKDSRGCFVLAHSPGQPLVQTTVVLSHNPAGRPAPGHTAPRGCSVPSLRPGQRLSQTTAALGHSPAVRLLL